MDFISWSSYPFCISCSPQSAQELCLWWDCSVISLHLCLVSYLLQQEACCPWRSWIWIYRITQLGSIRFVAVSSCFIFICSYYASISFYSSPISIQLSKLACIPFTLFVQYVAYKQSVPRLVQLTLIPISFGVGYATIYDLNLNMIGLGMPFSDHKLKVVQSFRLPSIHLLLLQYSQHVPWWPPLWRRSSRILIRKAWTAMLCNCSITPLRISQW